MKNPIKLLKITYSLIRKIPELQEEQKLILCNQEENKKKLDELVAVLNKNISDMQEWNSIIANLSGKVELVQNKNNEITELFLQKISSDEEQDLQNKISENTVCINELREDMKNKAFECNESMKHLKREASECNESMEHLKKEALWIKKQNELYFEVMFQKPGEQKEDARKRFFRSIPKTGGDIELYQQGNVKLLKELIALCKQYDCNYWLQSGTLLGAVRHNGFVPWDDDTDIAMLRADINKLRKALESNDKYYISLIYDYCWKSRQLRFRPRNREIPCFIDIYIYDVGNEHSDKAWERWQEEKKSIMECFSRDSDSVIKEWEREFYVEDTSELGMKLKEKYDEYYEKESVLEKRTGNSIVWGLDNFIVSWNRLFDKDFLFPTKQLMYEGILCNVPKEYEKHLERQYGDIYKLPDDLVTHYQHVDHKSLNKDVLRKFLEED